MPNWVNNRLYVKNTGPEFNTLREIFTKNEYPFEKIHPMPSGLSSKIDEEILCKLYELKRVRKEYWNLKINKLIGKLNIIGFNLPKIKDFHHPSFMETLSRPKVNLRAPIKQKIKNLLKSHSEEKNLKKYGAKDWHEWRCKNWGTKWDACNLEVIYSGENEFCIEFETAWTDPAGIYVKLELDFPNSILMTLAHSMESDFIRCASHMPGQGWKCEDLGNVFDANSQFRSSRPSDHFIDFAKQFDTKIVGWFMETPSDKNQAV